MSGKRRNSTIGPKMGSTMDNSVLLVVSETVIIFQQLFVFSFETNGSV